MNQREKLQHIQKIAGYMELAVRATEYAKSHEGDSRLDMSNHFLNLRDYHLKMEVRYSNLSYFCEKRANSLLNQIK
jgi:hypothetical protein